MSQRLDKIRVSVVSFNEPLSPEDASYLLEEMDALKEELRIAESERDELQDLTFVDPDD